MVAMQQIADWLKMLGMSEYAERFAESDIDTFVLRDLTDQDLKELGVSLGHRRKMLRAIAELAGAAPTSPQPALTEPKPQHTTERRQVTVMFSDLVGSTALSARMDPEDLREVISAYQNCVAETVGRFGGFVAKYMGDGVLVYFGYPQAHEDDAERAVRTGLALLEAVAAIRPTVPTRPQIRVGITTGLVVIGELIGEGAAEERVAVGETLNLAARMQAVASPDSMVVGELTRQLAGAAFDYQDLGPRELKGIPGELRLWRVMGESGVRGRFDSRVIKGLTPFVGRAEEVGLLRRRWDYAKDGDGQLILLSAPAGFGKSRITQAFREQLGDSSITCLQYFGSPFHVNSPFYPFIRHLEWTAGIVRTDTGTQKLDKLEGILEGTAESKIEAAPLLAALLSIPFGERYPPLQINELVKQRTMEILEEQLIQLSSRGPVLVVFEDAHWIDPTSLELMNKVIRRVADLPVMIIATHRPEFAPPWLDLGHVTMLKLNQLGRSEVIDLIHKAAGGKTLPETIVAQIAAKSECVPLFIEEITQSILESGDLGRLASVTSCANRFEISPFRLPCRTR
jgi:class 3 adenylate cyclase